MLCANLKGEMAKKRNNNRRDGSIFEDPQE